MSPRTETIEIYSPEHFPECKNCPIADELVCIVFRRIIHNPNYIESHPKIRIACPAKDHPVCPTYKTPPSRLH